MADEKDLEKAKAIAAAKAKAAAAAKAKAAALAKSAGASESSTTPTDTSAPTEATTEPAAPAEGDDLATQKAKAIAAAKAKAAAAAAAKAKALGQEAPATDTADGDDAKAKAIAAAKAKAAAAAAAKAKALGQEVPATDAADGDDAKAKAIAAAKAKAAAVAAAKAKAAGGSTGATAAAAPEEEKPSKNRPTLDLIVKKITDTVGADAIEESYINFLSKEVPTLVIRKEKLIDVMNLLYNDTDLDFKYLSNLHGIDHESHMEVYYYLQSYSKRHYVAIRVKTDRDAANVPSVSLIWYGANWQEREAYDLLGINFEGHPNMKRMFLPENWVGHPLRKDYVQFDEEV